MSQSFPCFTKTDDEMLSVADIVRICHNLPLKKLPLKNENKPKWLLNQTNSVK
ncbi:hypothetical protein AO374_1855 [Moraxella catarrhalis]|nr:hypothetical protein AO374_1855 [Moraxella catarrhalis]